MRLYNASSCTPCCSTWEGAAARRRPEQHSFVPPQSDSSSERTEPSFVHQTDQKQGPPHKFQQLTKIPSSSTSTTGGLTPLFDNTGSSPSFSHHDNAERNPAHILTEEPAYARKANQHAQRSRSSAIHPPLNHASNAPQYDKYNAIDGIVDLDITEDDVESSSSTLTTTRSMMLQQQEQCTITVSSAAHGKGAEVYNKKVHSTSTSRFEPKIYDRQSTNKLFHKQDVINIGIAESAPALRHLGRQPSADPAKKLLNVPTRSNTKIQATGNVPKKESSKTSTTLRPEESTSRSPDIVDFSSKPTRKMHPAETQARGHLPRFRGSNADDDLVVDKNTRLRKSPLQDVGRVEFFPLQTPSVPMAEHSDEEVPARLGVTSNFPSISRLPSESTDGNQGRDWDPFQDLDPFQTTVSNDEGELCWATFGSFEELYPGIDSTDSGYSFFSFHGETHDSAHLDDKENLMSNNSDESGTGSERKNAGWDMGAVEPRKTLLRRGGTNTRKHSFFDKKKLLGPRLEARFTRSYWRRLKQNRDELSVTKQSTTVESLQAGEQAANEERQRPRVEIAPGDLPTKRGVQPATPATNNEDNWCESLSNFSWGFDQQPFGNRLEEVQPPGGDRGTSTNRNVVIKIGSAKRNDLFENSGVQVLSPRRVRECNAVLRGIAMETEQILAAIDVADVSPPLTLEQILGLRSILPTPVEERMLHQHVKVAPQAGSGVDMSDPGELFMLSLAVSINQARPKLEKMLFQLEMGDCVHDLRTAVAAQQRVCDEVTKSANLEKFLGIVTLFANRGVGKVKGRKRTTRLTLPELSSILDDAASYTSESKKEPLLVFACSKIRATKPAMLSVRRDMPSLGEIAAAKTSYHSLKREFQQLEEKFDETKTFAVGLALSKSRRRVHPDDLSVHEEIDILESVSVGRFVLNSSLLMAELYEAFDAMESSIVALMDYFAVPQDQRHQPDLVLQTVERLLCYMETFMPV
ncbi:activator of morphogenesis [Seminavis robusta]|uniref:Activator of morphogenesis n=1 Tax=Seminavis robusta TaxID=568900 RepID=A0A9N8ERF4_9STRA|nr:activator of morphogenesis [Seminavis robusta]|eukprot:Sro1452_g273890.1 activator of morphogenesis (976) ;mRNA; f:11845-14772